MRQHNQNALAVAEWLSSHPKIEAVYYPGLTTHPGYEIAKKQMFGFGGMLAFEVKGGLSAGKDLMDHLKMISLVPTLGNCDTIVQHPASMSHVGVPREERLLSGITDGLVRFSTGIENVADLITDLEQALG